MRVLLNLVDLKSKAETGNSAAQAILGITYLYGTDGIEVDYTQAYRWLSAAAEKGVSRAIANLASMYEGGLGIQKDTAKAKHLYERVGRVEFMAALALGRIYSSGVDVPQDPVKAFRWYSAAVEFEADILDCDELREARAYIRTSVP